MPDFDAQITAATMAGGSGGSPPPPGQKAVNALSNVDATVISSPDATVVAGPDATLLAAPDATALSPQSTTGGGSGSAGMPIIQGYVIGKCLGQGGMGAVYEGVQESTGRRVAIKLMLDSALASDEGRKRFEREVAVVARLEHPAVVAIIDSGVRKGNYYYVMEFVEGSTLDHVLKRGACDIRRAFELVAEICDAVEYAHQRGVLHRDLKPANVLVDTRGRIRLLDFGIAQVLGEDAAQSRQTLSSQGQIVGTVAYMSPEQAAGNVSETSIRTDVYALGAIAYDLLTGKLPCPTDGSLMQILKRIAEVDPPKPSSIRKGLSRDIDAMLLKALEKVPAKRYSTSGEFAADIRRFLAGQPVQARPVGPAGRMYRWVKRNRTLTGVGVFSFIVLVVVSTGLLMRIVRENQINKENWTRFAKIFDSADTESGAGGTGGTVLQMLEKAHDELDKSPPSSDESEAEIREVLGSALRKFAKYDKAIVDQRRVLEVREKHVRGDDPKVAKALHNLAATLWWNGEYVESEKLYIRELEMLQRLHPGDHPDTAFAMTGLAACRLRLGRVDSARGDYAAALAMRYKLLDAERDPDAAKKAEEQVAAALNNLAKCDLEIESFENAEKAFRAAYAMIIKLRGPEFINTAAAATNLADCILRRGQLDYLDGDTSQGEARAQEALNLYKTAYDIRNKRFPAGHDLTAVSLVGLARASLTMGLPKDALGYSKQAVDMMKKLKREEHPGMIEVLETNAMAAAGIKDLDGARRDYENAIKIASQAKSIQPTRLAELQAGYGSVLVQIGEHESGLKLLRNSYAMVSNAHGKSNVVARQMNKQLSEAELLIASDGQKPN